MTVLLLLVLLLSAVTTLIFLLCWARSGPDFPAALGFPYRVPAGGAEKPGRCPREPDSGRFARPSAGQTVGNAAARHGAPERTTTMRFKGNAKVRQLKGKVTESVGKAMGDPSVQRAGRREQLRGKAQEMTQTASDRVRKWTKR